MTRYRTIVADPPWAYPGGTGKNLGERDYRGTGSGPTKVTQLPYASMSVAEIAALPVREMAESDCHLYLWTTNRYLRDAYDIAAGWGFTVSKPLVWCKEPMGFMGKPYVSSAEFVLFCRRGVLRAVGDAGRQWWNWPRTIHSAKPEAFLDLVEQVSPGPYLEMFARRNRLGWDTWGNESLVHVDVEGGAA